MNSPKVIVVMPAYNAAKTLERTYRDIPAGIVSEVILVDDVSADETVEVAERLGLKVVVHTQNRGYGGNQRTCYIEALEAGADIFEEASSVNFANSVIYGSQTLFRVALYALDGWHLLRVKRFRKKLAEVVSRHHRQEIFGLRDEAPYCWAASGGSGTRTLANLALAIWL